GVRGGRLRRTSSSCADDPRLAAAVAHRDGLRPRGRVVDEVDDPVSLHEAGGLTATAAAAAKDVEAAAAEAAPGAAALVADHVLITRPSPYGAVDALARAGCAWIIRQASSVAPPAPRPARCSRAEQRRHRRRAVLAPARTPPPLRRRPSARHCARA